MLFFCMATTLGAPLQANSSSRIKPPTFPVLDFSLSGNLFTLLLKSYLDSAEWLSETHNGQRSEVNIWLCFRDYTHISEGTTDKKKKRKISPWYCGKWQQSVSSKKTSCAQIYWGKKAFVPAFNEFQTVPAAWHNGSQACCSLLQVLAGTGLDVRFTFLSPRGVPLARDLYRSDGIHMWVVTLKGKLSQNWDFTHLRVWWRFLIHQFHPMDHNGAKESNIKNETTTANKKI